MKHNFKITILLLTIFLGAQIIGLVIANEYLMEELPYGFERPEITSNTSYIPLIIAVILATILALVLARFKLVKLWKLWFFISILFVLSISFSAYLNHIISFLLAGIVSYFKTFKRNIIIHNLSELFIYGGLAAIFVPVLNLFSVSILLVLISIYDYIAVFKTKHMVSLAKFQSKLKLFAGIHIPYRGGEAILGGGDIGFPLLFAGVLLNDFGYKAFIIPVFTTLALLGLFLLAKKKKYYPAMPAITLGCFIGYLVLILGRGLF